MACLSAAGAQAKDVYGFLTGSSNIEAYPVGMYKFSTTGSAAPELQQPLMFRFWGGAFAGKTYYMFLSDDFQGYMSEGLCTYDIKTKQAALGYAWQGYGCADMTYDCTGETMYGIMAMNGGEPTACTLITVNLDNGERTAIAELSDKLTAIACNAEGQLYGMSASGMLYSIDKCNGALAEIGATGITTDNTQAASMEFDRDTNQLYWTALDTGQQAFFAQLNPATGQVLERTQLKGNALIAGLHIPFNVINDNAPAAPVNLGYIKDGLEVMLMWTNPNLNYAGSELTMPLTKAEIYRNGLLIHTIDSPVPGNFVMYTDNVDPNANGEMKYEVFLYNEAGRGEGAVQKVPVGDDIPAAVSGLKAEQTDNGATLTWTAPTEGQTGGAINPDNLKYKVTRMPDALVVADNIQQTTATDNTVTSPGYYWYEVVCFNASGASYPECSDTLALGGALAVPYNADLTNPLYGAHWMVADRNADGTKWTYNSQDGFFMYFSDFFNSANDALVSVPFTLQKGVPYVVNYTISAPSVIGSSEKFRISLAKDGMQTEIEYLDGYSNATDDKRKVPFTVSEDGQYTFIMEALSDADQFAIYIKGFSLSLQNSTDLAVTAVSGSTEVNAGQEGTLTVTVANEGTTATEGYAITVTGQDGTLLGALNAGMPVQPGESVDNIVKWTAAAGATSLTVAVVADGDNIAANNTKTIDVCVVPEGEKYVEVGAADSHPTLIPFSFEGFKYSYSQTIYMQSETGCKPGYIKEVRLPYTNNSSTLAARHIKLMLGNTDRTSVQDGWTADSQLQTVFDGTVDFPAGQGTLIIVFSTPFEYQGRNLEVVWKKLDDMDMADVRFNAMNCGEGNLRTAIYNGYSEQVDLPSVEGSCMLCNMKMRVCEDAAVAISSVNATGNGVAVRGGMLVAEGSRVAGITIADLGGKTVARTTGAAVSVASLPQGVYVARISTPGQTQTVKIVIR